MNRKLKEEFKRRLFKNREARKKFAQALTTKEEFTLVLDSKTYRIKPMSILNRPSDI